MCRALALVIVVLMTSQIHAVQALGNLHIKLVIVDAKGQSMPVPRYRLQISDNPATAPPRRVITTLDGTLVVRLPAGNYTVESERPLIIDGKSYEWTMVVDVGAGRDAKLELT